MTEANTPDAVCGECGAAIFYDDPNHARTCSQFKSTRRKHEDADAAWLADYRAQQQRRKDGAR